MWSTPMSFTPTTSPSVRDLVLPHSPHGPVASFSAQSTANPPRSIVVCLCILLCLPPPCQLLRHPRLPLDHDPFLPQS